MIAAIQLSAAAREFACQAIFATKDLNDHQTFAITDLNVYRDVAQMLCVQLSQTVLWAALPTVSAQNYAALLVTAQVPTIVIVLLKLIVTFATKVVNVLVGIAKTIYAQQETALTHKATTQSLGF